jgi:hypothetical protein
MNQTQREATIELLTLAIYTDAHISLQEDALLESTIATLGWESVFPKQLFIEKAWVAARKAADTAESTATYVGQRASLFTTAPDQTSLYSLVHQTLAADGVHADENSFLKLLNDSFPTPAL